MEQSGSSINYLPNGFVDFYDDAESQEAFHRVSSSDIMGMVSTDGSDLEEGLLGTGWAKR